MSDDEDFDLQRQRIQHPDDPDDVEMDNGSGSDSDAEQVCSSPFFCTMTHAPMPNLQQLYLLSYVQP